MIFFGFCLQSYFIFKFVVNMTRNTSYEHVTPLLRMQSHKKHASLHIKGRGSLKFQPLYPAWVIALKRGSA